MDEKKKIDRRNFIKISAIGATVAGAAALTMNSGKLFTVNNSGRFNPKIIPTDTKKLFWQYGTCSQTLHSILNREFGHPKEVEGRASDPLAGGMMHGYQCGMLWGSVLAVGAESYRRFNYSGQATAKAITASQHILVSFSKRAKSVNCRDILGFEFSDKFNQAKFILSSIPGGFNNMVCMNLAEKWAPEAIQSAKEGLSVELSDMPELPLSCASEVVKKMGGSDEEIIMVSGFAGGMGLSGNACGALGAAIWMNSLAWCRKNPGKSGYSNPKTKELLKLFSDTTGSEYLCKRVSGCCFNTIRDHTEFVKKGGCEKLINALSYS